MAMSQFAGDIELKLRLVIVASIALAAFGAYTPAANNSSWNASWMYWAGVFPGATFTGPMRRHSGLSLTPVAIDTLPRLTVLPPALRLCWIVMTFSVDALYGIEFVVSQPATPRAAVKAMPILSRPCEFIITGSPLLNLIHVICLVGTENAASAGRRIDARDPDCFFFLDFEHTADGNTMHL
jgi:hypothetical protein